MSWQELNENEKRQCEERFITLTAADALRRQVEEEGRTRRYGFGDVFQFATQPHFEMTKALQEAIDRDRKLQAALDQLMASSVIYQFPRAAAASSGDVDRREGDGFSVQIKASRAQEGQVYVIIKMVDAFQDEPSAITLKSGAGHYYKKGLPISVDGVFQFLAEEKEDFIQALRDISTEVYLS